MTLFCTIGHSTRSRDELAALLRASDVRLVCDVRSIPRSRANPQYDRATLPEMLAERQLGYVLIPALAGRRGRERGAGPSPNAMWRVTAFRNYADYALTSEFAEGLAELRVPGAARTSAIMCTEAVWWRCHRRIITDYLLAGGDEVRHILGPGHLDQGTMTPGDQMTADGHVLYPPEGLETDAVSPEGAGSGKD